MNRHIVILSALLCGTLHAAERGAEALLRSTQASTSVIYGGRQAVIIWDSVPLAVRYDLVIRNGITVSDPIVASTNETQAASNWLMQQPAFRSKVRSVWIRAVGSDGQASAWAGPLKFIKLD